MRIEKFEEGIRLKQEGEVIEELRIHELNPLIQKKLTVYGLFVKVQRSTAGKSGQEKAKAMLDTVKALRQGEWNKKQDTQSIKEKVKAELIESIKDPKLKEKLKKELGLA